MNRRTFLTRICGGAVAAAVATRMPLSWVPEPIRRQGAIDYMVKAYNARMRGHGAKAHPSLLTAGADLFDAFESEIIVVNREVFGHDALFTNIAYPGSLKFKAATLRRGGPGWWMTFDN